MEDLPAIDESISEDNNNKLKFFERKPKDAFLKVPPRSKTAAERAGNETLFESDLPRTILLFDLNLKGGGVSCEKPCDVITDKSLIRHTDVVVFDGSNLNREDIPDKKHPDQLYVWYSEDSSAEIKRTLEHKKRNLKEFDSVFDLTMYYRSDSDVVFSNQTMKMAESELLTDEYFDDLHRNKSRLSYWIPQNCAGQSASWMMDIMYQLHIAVIHVDVFGDVCPDTSYSQQQQQPNDPRIYKFYIHFSSTPGCRDFVDDEVWTRALDIGVVPVIFGATAADLRRRLPKNSYISTDQFASPYELVNFLEYLDTDTEAYKQYFIWRFNPAPPPVSAMCELCKQVYPFPKQPTIKSLENWLFDVEPEQCLDFVEKRDFKFYRQYVHLAYLIDNPTDYTDTTTLFMLYATIAIAIVSLIFLVALNFPFIRHLRIFIFVSTKLVIIVELLIELAKTVWNKRMSSSPAGYKLHRPSSECEHGDEKSSIP